MLIDIHADLYGHSSYVPPCSLIFRKLRCREGTGADGGNWYIACFLTFQAFIFNGSGGEEWHPGSVKMTFPRISWLVFIISSTNGSQWEEAQAGSILYSTLNLAERHLPGKHILQHFQVPTAVVKAASFQKQCTL